MITHTISRFTRAPKNVITGLNKKDYPRFIGTQGTDEHRRYLLKRAIHTSPFRLYDQVVYRRNTYTISEIYSDFELVSWVGLSPKFIELTNIQNEYQYVNPGDIKKARK